MPAAADVPQGLEQFTRINAFRIDDASFHRDLARLTGSLRDYDPAAFARKLRAASWDDLVVPHDARCALQLAVADVQLRTKILDDWGLEDDRPAAMTIAISGPEGCGKTLAARCLACELGLDLYQINLEEATLRWRTGDRLPIDWLFKRSVASPVLLQIRDTTGLLASTADDQRESRRFAASLVRQLEDRDGLMILTSRQSLGAADRSERFDHVVDIPFPDEPARKHIWQRTMPREMPIESDVDYDALAAVRLSGQSIRRAIRRAALHAASDGRYVSMQYLQDGAGREWETTYRSAVDAVDRPVGQATVPVTSPRQR